LFRCKKKRGAEEAVAADNLKGKFVKKGGNLLHGIYDLDGKGADLNTWGRN